MHNCFAMRRMESCPSGRRCRHSKCGLRRIDATWVRIPCSPLYKAHNYCVQQKASSANQLCKRCFLLFLFLHLTVSPVISPALSSVIIMSTIIFILTAVSGFMILSLWAISQFVFLLICLAAVIRNYTLLFPSNIHVPFHICFLCIS